MNVYLLPHHRLDPRFRYSLEREAAFSKPPSGSSFGLTPAKWGLCRKLYFRTKHLVVRLRHEYDHIVHGREQIRLSRLLISMDRDDNLTIVIPAGMTREWARDAVRGVIRAGLMAHRSHVGRNLGTAGAMLVILFLTIPTHILGIVLFFLVVSPYAWLRHREDRLIRRTLTHLLDVRLNESEHGHFREDIHLAHLEEAFTNTPNPGAAYRKVKEQLSALDEGRTDLSNLDLICHYFHDIGRLDPYERCQDRIRKELVKAVKLVWHHIYTMTERIFRATAASLPVTRSWELRREQEKPEEEQKEVVA